MESVEFSNLTQSEYEVEQILSHRRKRKYIEESKKYFYIKEYLIKWTGYDETTWEPEDNLLHCQELLGEYWENLEKEKLKKRKLYKEKTPQKILKKKEYIYSGHNYCLSVVKFNKLNYQKRRIATSVREMKKSLFSSDTFTISDIKLINSEIENKIGDYKSKHNKDNDKKEPKIKEEQSIIIRNNYNNINENEKYKKRKNKNNNNNNNNKNKIIKEISSFNESNSNSQMNTGIDSSSSIIYSNPISNMSEKVSNSELGFGPSFYEVLNATKNISDENGIDARKNKFIEKKRKRSDSMSSLYSISVEKNSNIKTENYNINKHFLSISQVKVPSNKNDNIYVTCQFENKGKTFKIKGTSKLKDFPNKEIFNIYEEIIKSELSGKTFNFPEFVLKK